MAKKLTKMEKKAKQILANEEKEKRAYRNKRIKEVIEIKMQRGHSLELASEMARQLVDG
jgi:hypothetical protein